MLFRSKCQGQNSAQDTGGQYKDGTTDVTRTVHFGCPSEVTAEPIFLVNFDGCLKVVAVNLPFFVCFFLGNREKSPVKRVVGSGMNLKSRSRKHKKTISTPDHAYRNHHTHQFCFEISISNHVNQQGRRQEQKRFYTRVLQGHIGLATAIFPEGTCGLLLG